MFTAKGQEDDKIRGFELGVEDYVTKPFLPSEILARIKSLLKRTKSREENDSLKFHDININLTNRRATRGERKLNLGPTEFNLLKFFIENKGRVYSRQQLLDNVWLNDAYVEPEKNMSSLEKRLAAEKRFKFYGMFAMTLSLFFVLILMYKIFSTGSGAFVILRW